MLKNKGFTLIEIIVVMVIIGILATIAIPGYITMMEQGMAKSAQNNLMTIYNAQKNCIFNSGTYCTAIGLTAINQTANLNLSDNNFIYQCVGSPVLCTANRNSSGVTLTLSLKNPIVLPGGSSCASSTGAFPGCNPSCLSATNPSYCP